jgi:hypothetical protein
VLSSNDHSTAAPQLPADGRLAFGKIQANGVFRAAKSKKLQISSGFTRKRRSGRSAAARLEAAG